MKKPLVILSGPTAVGKTNLSIQLAKAINGEIISADSIQVYKELNIGSAKISKDEMQGVKHYLIDELEPDKEFNIYTFKELALKYMNIIYSKGKIPIITGGTGFYVQALLYDIQLEEEDNSTVRSDLERLAKEKGNSYIHDMLKEIDPAAAQNIHENNLKRVIRAIEFYKISGKKISEHNLVQSNNESPYNFAYFVLNRQRELLYERINKRVDIMLDMGLIEEVRQLREKGYSKNLQSMQGIGYKEINAYLDGEISLEKAVDDIKKNSRHYAKRQLTWFRREKEVIMLDYENYDNQDEKMLDYMIKVINDKNIM